MIKYKSKMEEIDICERVRWLLGVNEAFLSDEEILSPTIDIATKKYINSYLKNIEINNPFSDIVDLLDLSTIYYTAYQICLGMPVRLPIKMENISTKTTLQTVDWSKIADDLFVKCNSALDDILEQFGIEAEYGNIIVDMSDESTYPSEFI